MHPNHYLYRQVAYDYEPIFATGTMLGITDPFAVLRVMDMVEKMGLDVMSAGVALAWAAEATEMDLISIPETLVPLTFGDAEGFIQATHHLGHGSNDFYRVLNQGTLKATEVYGGEDFACVLGQEMAGYATGEVYYASQALGFRHSHLDTGGYAYHQKHDDTDIDKAIGFLVADEQQRVFLTSMVACLFARSVYTPNLLADCLSVVGHSKLAAEIPSISQTVQQRRWRLRIDTGYEPDQVHIPKRFIEVDTWRGRTDKGFLKRLKSSYASEIKRLAGVAPPKA